MQKNRETGKAPTVKEVAREAGVSIATVSYALRCDPRVREETRVRVEEAAARLGYRRNPAFAVLGSRRAVSGGTGLPLAYVWQRTADGRALFYASVYEGVETRAAEMGYRVEDWNLDTAEAVESFLRMVKVRGLCGMVVGYLRDAAFLRRAELGRVAMVAERQFHQALPIHTVRAGRFQEARVALRMVREHGYRHILALNHWHGPNRLEDDYARFGGLQAGRVEVEADGGGAWVRIVDPPGREDRSAWQGLLREHRPEVVIAFNGWAWWLLGSAGIVRPPEAPAYVALERDVEQVGPLTLAGCTNGNRQIGALAVEWLDELIRRGALGLPEQPRSQVVQPRWVDGTSLPRRD